MSGNSEVLDIIAARLWAIQSHWLEAITLVAQRAPRERVAEALGMTPEALNAKLDARLASTRTATVRDGTAIIPIRGPIFPRANMMTEVSGATSLQRTMQDFDAALSDQQVERIVLDIDSPGGMVTDIAEAADAIRASGKPVTAYVSGKAQSAAYWLASAADEIVISRTAGLGSIGVVATVPIQDGPGPDGLRKFEIISSNAPGKRADPRNIDDALKIRAEIDAIESVFMSDVARFRGVAVETVKEEFGRGGVKIGADAVAAGMADRIGTFEEVMAISNTRIPGMSEKPAAQAAATAPVPPAPTVININAGAAPLADAKPSALKLEPVADAADPVAAERNRITGIYALNAKYSGQNALIHYFAISGATVEQAEAALAAAAKDTAAAKGGAALDQLRKDLPGASAPVAPAAGSGAEPVSIEALPPKERWAQDSKLRAEFLSEADYLAFAKAEAEGRVKRFAPAKRSA